MKLSSFFKAVIDADDAPVVICDLSHTIVYMNPCAVQRYAKRGGEALVGRSLLDCHSPESVEKIKRVTEWFAADETHNKVFTFHNDRENKDVYMTALREDGKLIGYYEKHEYRTCDTGRKYELNG